MNRSLSSIFLIAALTLTLVAVMSLAHGPQLSHAREPRTLETSPLTTTVAGSLSYQGRLLDSNGDPVGGTQTMTFALYAEASGGSPLWSETQYGVPLDDGYFHVQLAVDVELFDGRELWLGVQVQGDLQELEPRQPMLPAPYALSLRPGATVHGSGIEHPALTILSDNDTGIYVDTYSTDPTDVAIWADNRGTGIGAWVGSTNGYGLFAHSFNDIGVYAQSLEEAAGFFQSVQGHGVIGSTVSDDPVVAAVQGQNDGLGPGVAGISIADAGVYGESTDGHGVAGFSVNEVGVYGQSLNTAAFFSSTLSIGVDAHTLSGDPGVAAVLGTNHGNGPGVYGDSNGGPGVAGFSVNDFGVYGQSLNTASFFTSTLSFGVDAHTLSGDPNVAAISGTNHGDGPGVAGFSTHGSGIYGESPDGFGVAGFSGDEAGVRGESATGSGVKGWGHEGAGVEGLSEDGPGGTFGSSSGPAILVEGAGLEGLRIMDAVGGDYIVAGSDGDFDFKVSNIGDVFADGSYHCGQGPGAEPGTCVIQESPADFAEMLASRGEMEPGDVLVIGPDGQLARSSRAFQPTVVGAYSTQPGYLGSGQFQGKAGYAPLAITGLVPVKASAENGPICPGDLLVASNTPGHAMRAGAHAPQGTVIGKALEGLNSGLGAILMLAMLQ